MIQYTSAMHRGSGVLVILMGLVFVGVFPRLSGEKRIRKRPDAGLAGAPLLGITFGFSWTPCIGPTFAAVAALSLGEASASRGALLAFGYAIGLGIPFILFALVFRRALGISRVLSRRCRAARAHVRLRAAAAPRPDVRAGPGAPPRGGFREPRRTPRIWLRDRARDPVHPLRPRVPSRSRHLQSAVPASPHAPDLRGLGAHRHRTAAGHRSVGAVDGDAASAYRYLHDSRLRAAARLPLPAQRSAIARSGQSDGEGGSPSRTLAGRSHGPTVRIDQGPTDRQADA